MEEPKRARRVPVTFAIVVEAEQAHYVAESFDVSETGLFLNTKGDFPVGTALRMVIGQPPELPRVDAEGVVKRVDPGKGVGVEFTRISPEGRKTLSDYLSSRAPADEAPERA